MPINHQYSFHFQPYQRPFKKPLRTNHGLWQIREGIIVTLIDPQGRKGQGEIAPIPWFGSETIKAAINFCQQHKKQITAAQISQIPSNLPACQFGFESALINIREKDQNNPNQQLNFCHLLPTGTQALDAAILHNNHLNNSTFKWKIAVDSLKLEIATVEKLIAQLPSNAKLRLDANGGLTNREAILWLEFCENQAIIEFLEQPLPPSQFSAMMALTENYKTTLALDESVSNLRQLITCYQQGWRDVLVVKPAIAGFPSVLRQFCQQHHLDLVFSSVFETNVGRQTALQLALELGNCDRAVGFGIDHWFD